MTRLLNLKDRQERLLRDLDRPDLLHALLALFLLLEEFALPRDVAAVTFGGHVLAQGPDGLARDHLGADRRLNHHLEQLPWDELLQLLGDLAAPLVRLVRVDDDAERVHRVAVEQHVELYQLGRPVGEELVVERRVAARDRLQLVVEVENDLGERKLPVELDARRVEVVHSLIHAPPLLTQIHDAADVVRRHEDPRLHERLFHAIDGGAVRHQAGVLHQLHRAVRLIDVVLHAGDRADEIEIELPLQTLAHDLHVQEPQESAAKPEAERYGGFGLVVQGRVVELQLGQG